MSYFDMFLIGVILVFALKGIFKGGIKETISLSIIFIALFIAPIFAESTASYVLKFLDWNISKEVTYFFGIGVIIILSIIMGVILNLLLMLVVSLTGLGVFNKILGFIVGGIKAFVIISIFISISLKIDISKKYLESYAKESKYLTKVVKIGDSLISKAKTVKKDVENNKSEIEDFSSDVANKIIKETNAKEMVKDLKDEKNQKNISDTINKGLEKLDKTINEQTK